MPTAVTRIFAPQHQAESLAILAEERMTLDELSIVVSETAADAEEWRLDLFGGPNIAPDGLEAEVRAALGEDIAGCRVETEVIQDADWVAQSLAGLDPVFAGRFFIHGGHDRRRVPGNAFGIQVEAALAFGTGHHGTTRGCLLAFDRLLKAEKPRRVLDLGTGTGVLAIAAAKALHRPVLASDIDATSVLIARENVGLNRTGDRVRVVHANGMRDPAIAASGPFDLIFANILAGPLVGLAPSIARAVVPGGKVILSGLLTHQERTVRAAYRLQGLIPTSRIVLNNWVTMTLAAG